MWILAIYAEKMCGFVSESEEKPGRALKTTRRYQEIEGAVMYGAGVEM